MLAESVQRLHRRLVLRFRPRAVARKIYLQMLGAKIGRRTFIPRLAYTWPHQIQIGCDCVLQDDLFFNYDHYWQPGPSIIIGDRVFIGRGSEFNIRLRLTIGDNSLIASGVKIIDHDHGIVPGQLMREQGSVDDAVSLESDVWVGVNAVILKGVTIAEGAVVAAGAVVNRSIPSMEIWGGVPARRIGIRGFDRTTSQT